MRGLERYVEGDEPVAVGPDLLAIPTPGHTPGSLCLLYRRTFLFTGDHLWWNPERAMLSASRSFNWYSWDAQLRSIERLLDFEFRHVLPGHGRRLSVDSPALMRRELERALARLRAAYPDPPAVRGLRRPCVPRQHGAGLRRADSRSGGPRAVSASGPSRRPW